MPNLLQGHSWPRFSTKSVEKEWHLQRAVCPTEDQYLIILIIETAQKMQMTNTCFSLTVSSQTSKQSEMLQATASALLLRFQCLQIFCRCCTESAKILQMSLVTKHLIWHYTPLLREKIDTLVIYSLLGLIFALETLRKLHTECLTNNKQFGFIFINP